MTSRRRGVYRGIYSVLLNDPGFRKLSPQARHTFLTMRLADYVGIACIWRFDPTLIAAQTGYPQDELEIIFKELADARWIAVDGEWMWLVNALKYDPTASLHNDRHKAGVIRAIAGVPRIPLLRKFCRYYHLPYPFDRHPKANRMPSEGLSPPNPIPIPNTDTDSSSEPVSPGDKSDSDEPQSPAAPTPTERDLAEHRARQERARALLKGAGLTPP